MFITQLRHKRNALGVWSGHSHVNSEGLGLVVTQTTKFDPTRMRSRFAHYLEEAVNEMAVQAREQIQSVGFIVDEWAGARANYRQAAIKAIPFNEMSSKVSAVTAKWDTTVVIPKMKMPSMAENIAMLYVSILNPFIGIGMAIAKAFGKKKKKAMTIPWNTLYAQAVPYAQEMTVQEELYRISEEVRHTKQVYVKEIEKVSRESALFKLPEHVVGIKRGAIVMALKGKPVEKRL